MEKLVKYIESCAKEEKYDIIEEYGLFNSMHEAYAIALEEWEEAKEALEFAKIKLDNAWKETRKDSELLSLTYYEHCYNDAILAAAECVQLAAVCLKVLERLDENNNE